MTGAGIDIEIAPNALAAVAIAPTDGHVAVVTDEGVTVQPWPGALAAIRRIEAEHRPRWVWWSKDTARHLVDHDVRPARCWDLAAVDRLLHGGWRTGPAEIWAHEHDLDVDSIPVRAPEDLFSALRDSGDPEEPLDADGHLRAEWVDGDWSQSATRVEQWAALALDVQRAQADRLDALGGQRAARTARSESAAELLCAELEHDGLPFDRATAEAIIADFVGPRPDTAADAAARTQQRDHEVLRHLPPGADYDLRSPDQVKSMLRRVGIEVPDTRSWRLERMTAAHPIVAPLIEWRRAERILTTFGYEWIDGHVGADDRLRGDWSGSDGAAGRMTATAGLHNMPAELRPAIAAAPDHVFVRADLGQIEPRILAAVAGDPLLAAATQDDDMYAPVARQLGVDREIAKVAVLGAMYGQTTGTGAQALARLEREYPVAMRYLHDADAAAQGGRELRTFGGRLVRTGAGWPGGDHSSGDAGAARSRAAARGRFGRNAMVQGAAAEFFKTWAVLVRARGATLGARIVLCLHDELLVHVPRRSGERAAQLVDDCLDEAAARWAPAPDHARPGPTVRFVSDTSIVSRWSDAKSGK